MSYVLSSLSIVSNRLQFKKHENALAALVSTDTLVTLDETGNEYEPDGLLARSIPQNFSITSLNGLSLSTESAGETIKKILTKSGKVVYFKVQELTKLERVFVMARYMRTNGLLSYSIR